MKMTAFSSGVTTTAWRPFKCGLFGGFREGGGKGWIRETTSYSFHRMHTADLGKWTTFLIA